MSVGRRVGPAPSTPAAGTWAEAACPAWKWAGWNWGNGPAAGAGADGAGAAKNSIILSRRSGSPDP